ncbi:hypothetical protein [Fibrobacter succinogenes]|uniref:hypothetical protein n=1 Tax=Fibrobacter succinogenes TaxID=833 RepID=UPI00156A363A|nr:hypothetical protein [Fibrobacter succinogenes]
MKNLLSLAALLLLFTLSACSVSGVNSKSTSSNLSNALSKVSYPRLWDDFEIPYIGKKLKIGEREYSTQEVVEIVSGLDAKVLQALQANMIKSENALLLDLPSVKKTLDTMSIDDGAVNALKVEDFLSAINIRIEAQNDSAADVFDVFKESEDVLKHVDVLGKSLAIEFYPKIEKQNVDFAIMNFETDINAVVSFDVKTTIAKDNVFLMSNYDSFVLDLPDITQAKVGKILPFQLNEGNLKISITSSGAQDNFEFNNKVKAVQFSIDKYFEKLEAIEIPLLDRNGFLLDGAESSVKNIAEIADDYSKFTQYGIALSIAQDYEIELSKLNKIIEKYLHKFKFLSNVAVLGKILTDDKIHEINNEEFVNLNEYSVLDENKRLKLVDGKNAVMYKLTLKPFKYARNVSLDLFNAHDFDSEMTCYFKLVFYVHKGSKAIALDHLDLDKMDLALSANVEKIQHGKNVFVFGDGSQRNKGKLSYSVSFNPKNAESVDDFHPLLNIDYESLKIMDDGNVVKILNNNNLKERFSYDFKKRMWNAPNSLE